MHITHGRDARVKTRGMRAWGPGRDGPHTIYSSSNRLGGGVLGDSVNTARRGGGGAGRRDRSSRTISVGLERLLGAVRAAAALAARAGSAHARRRRDAACWQDDFLVAGRLAGWLLPRRRR